jgi:hypothetical protein
VMELGASSTYDGTGSNANRIVNPGTENSYQISISTTAGDSGNLRVAILDDVVVTASVDTSLTFTVSGVDAEQTINGDGTTAATSTATTMPFGTLASGTAKILAQDLALSTNAPNGFSVTIQQDQNIQSGSGADIDLFRDGFASLTPAAWAGPGATLDIENSYGHYGVTSEDDSLTFGDEFGIALYSGAFGTTAREIFYHTGPADGVTTNIGATRVGIKIEIGDLQEAATDYTNSLTYVATPIF